jgi:hypothetical protein
MLYKFQGDLQGNSEHKKSTGIKSEVNKFVNLLYYKGMP